MNPDKIEPYIKLGIAATFCITVLTMVMLSMYSLVFVTQPMSGIAPADKQFFFLLSDMSKYILGSLARCWPSKARAPLRKCCPLNRRKKMFPLTALLEVGGKLVDKLIPDPEAKAKAQAELAKMAQEGELARLANDTKLFETEQNNLTDRLKADMSSDS